MICFDTTMGSGTPVRGCRVLGEQAWFIPSLISCLLNHDSDFCPQDIHLIIACSQHTFKPAFIFLFLINCDLQAFAHLIKNVTIFFPLTSLIQPDPELEAWAGFPQALDEVAPCSWSDECGDTQMQSSIKHHSIGTQILSSNF